MRRLSIYDVAPTILEFMGSEVPKDMKGKAIKEVLA
jgi:bisphosphoglycerate-independent phosphoglycerate mutase (AlkP superfamily)